MIKRFFAQFFKAFYLYLRSKRVRDYVNLQIRYGGIKNYQSTEIKFSTFRITVPDVPAFLDQYENIFYLNSFRFESDTTTPLIYDCGANAGLATLYFKKYYPNCMVKAFEADPAIAAFFQKNMIANGIEEVRVVNKAVWIHNVGVGFVEEGGQGGRVETKSDPKIIPISSCRLKDLLIEEGFVDFLKLDIEGAEFVVLQDCEDQLHKVKNLFVEYHCFKNRKNKLGELLTLLENAGFQYFLQNNCVWEPFLFNSAKSIEFTVEIFARRKKAES